MDAEFDLVGNNGAIPSTSAPLQEEEREPHSGKIVQIHIPESNPEGRPKEKPEQKNKGMHKFPGRPPELALPQFLVVMYTARNGTVQGTVNYLASSQGWSGQPEAFIQIYGRPDRHTMSFYGLPPNIKVSASYL